MLALHKQYGNTVRVGPNELAFFSPEGFKDIYTKRAGHKLPPKDRSHYPLPPNGVDNIVTANDEAYHARHRRLLGYAFSEKALKEQEPILQSYVDLFVARLRDQASRGPVDIKSFFNFLIFDITGDLMFGESFGCLEESKLHPWVELFFSAAKAYSYLIAVSQFPWVKSILEPLIPRKVVQEGLDHFKLTAEKVDKRLAMKTERPDIISFALRNGMREGHGLLASESEKTMSRAEMHSNAYVMIAAGSEEPATHLSGCMYYLLVHPQSLNRLTHEIRATFASETDITMSAVANLPFLAAVIEESFRIYSPFVTSLTRVVPKGGDTIAGEYVPEGTIVAAHLYASFHSPSNFASPESFLPERWLGTDARFKNDRRDVLHPASLGPRGCIGKALGYAEIRLVLSKLLWNFDLELCDESRNWVHQEVYIIWDKPALMVRLRDRRVAGKGY
ncbi:MAG: Cytochrome E- group I [Lasallia pustulata]|uniref:Cytochrome E-group I n=1 Tax=Lasallia pustulata TaxID=136370 RepID=A0A5M8Q5G3_9LECA|nr:MAG: Cytochrome E- group I [Lasallia pustulata]